MYDYQILRQFRLSAMYVLERTLHILNPLLRKVTLTRLVAASILLMTIVFASFNLAQNGYSMPFLIGTVLTVLSMLSYFYMVSKIYRVSLITTLCYFMLGIFALVFSIAAANLYIWLTHIDTSSLVLISVATPIIEEVTKTLFVAVPYFIISRIQRFNSVARPAIIPLALMIGITFSQLETLGLREWSSTSPLRMVEYIVIPAHAAFTGLVGLSLEISFKKARPLLMSVGLFVAMVMHIFANKLVFLAAIFPALQTWLHLYFAIILLVFLGVMLAGSRISGKVYSFFGVGSNAPQNI